MYTLKLAQWQGKRRNQRWNSSHVEDMSQKTKPP